MDAVGLSAAVKQGLAYKKQAAVNWCPSCKTVLANEQVIGGACERCDTHGRAALPGAVVLPHQRLRGAAARRTSTASTGRRRTKTAQRNWIGTLGRRGDLVSVMNDGERAQIRVFTTRPDTIFGATYLVLAPEHPLVDALTTRRAASAVDRVSRAHVKQQDLVTRKTNKEKTGVFTGSYAINPATGKQIPIWISDYVLMEYGTGAIMAVPATTSATSSSRRSSSCRSCASLRRGREREHSARRGVHRERAADLVNSGAVRRNDRHDGEARDRRVARRARGRPSRS